MDGWIVVAQNGVDSNTNAVDENVRRNFYRIYSCMECTSLRFPNMWVYPLNGVSLCDKNYYEQLEGIMIVYIRW